MTNEWDSLPRPTTGNSPDELFLAVGRALTHWERLEYRVSNIYAALVSPGQFSYPAIRAFGTVASSSNRMAMTVEAARIFTFAGASDLQERLLKFLNTVGQFTGRRNEIAHGAVASVKTGAVTGFLLLPAFYNARKFKADDVSRATYMYGVKEIDHYTSCFQRLIADAERLLSELEALPVVRGFPATGVG